MDGGSLIEVIHRVKKLPEDVIGKITIQVLKGLEYLHKKLHLIHRDIKPHNLLLSKSGDVKISDFGVSGQLAHTLSKAASWVGTVTYMSPDRIGGTSYSYDSDIWSLGLSLVECALGYFPYINEGNRALGFWDLMAFIVQSPPPKLPEGQFSKEFCSFIELCLQKKPEDRCSATTLLKHPWLTQVIPKSNANLAEWFTAV